MKDEFISTVSHELRTPLTSIIGSIGLIVGGTLGPLPEQADNLLQIVRDNGDRLLALINDLLDVEQITTGNMAYHMEELVVGEVIEEAVKSHQGYAEQFGVTIASSITCADTRVHGDKARLLQVMANLLSNATKYSPKGDTIEVSAATAGENVRISVSDNGPGIPLEFRQQIFEKFTQADASDTRLVGGTGLGLWICKAIVDHHEGQIGFDTETGAGTTFFVVLPSQG